MSDMIDNSEFERCINASDLIDWMMCVFPDWCEGDVRHIMDHIDEMPSAQPEQRWIPCSERLPKEYGNYLITTHNGDVDVGTIDPKKKGVWSACDADGFYWIREVVAWMPLPKPYREVSE